jgi:hypothetical protein
MSDRHVVLPPDIAKLLPKNRLLSEVRLIEHGFEQSEALLELSRRRVTNGLFAAQTEWRGLGVQQSRGWVHYAIHRPEPHIMLFRCACSLIFKPDAETRLPASAFFHGSVHLASAGLRFF